MVRKGFSDSVVFEQRSEGDEGKGNADSRSRALQGEHSKYKGQEEGGDHMGGSLVDRVGLFILSRLRLLL